MGFFSGIGNFLGDLFGGDDEDKKKKQRQSSVSRPASKPLAIQKPRIQEQDAPAQKQERDKELTLVIPGQEEFGKEPEPFQPLLKKAIDERDQPAQKLNRYTQDKLPSATREVSGGSLLTPLTKSNRDRSADVDARNKAAGQYMRENPGVQDPALKKFVEETNKRADRNMNISKAKSRAVDSIAKPVQDAFYKVADVAQWVPGAGTGINYGLAGAERLYKATGDKGGEKFVSDARKRVDFGMTPEQYDALDIKTQEKLQLMRNAGLAIAPLDFVGAGGIAKNEIASTAKTALLQKAKTGAVSQATKQAVKQALKKEGVKSAVSGAAGVGISAAGQQYLSGDVNWGEAAKTGLLTAGVSSLTPESVGRKAVVEDTMPGVKNAIEDATPGVKSVNPNREADAAAQNAAKAAEEAAKTSAIEEANIVNAPKVTKPADTAVRTADTPLVKVPGPAETPTQAVTPPVAPIVDQPNRAVDVPPARTLVGEEVLPSMRPEAQAIARQADEAAAARMVPVEDAAPVASAEPTQIAEAITDNPPIAAPDTAPIVDEAIDTFAAPAEQTPVTPEIPQIPASTIGETVDVAPRTHDELVKSLGPIAQEGKGKYAQKLPMNIDELRGEAAAVIANMDDDSLLRAFASADPGTLVRDPQSYSVARAALDRLGKMPDDPAAVQTVMNIMEGMERYAAKSGEGLRIIQEEFDAMPLPMKVRYIVKKIDKANAEVDGYSPIKDDPALAAKVEADITQYLQRSEAIREQVAQGEGLLTSAMENARNGIKSDQKIDAVIKLLKSDKRELAANNGELVKYYNQYLPDGGKGRKANDWARRMMLASFTGRINDLITTGANVVKLGAEGLTQGLIAKGVNFFKPGTVTDTWKGARQLVQGTTEGLQKSKGEFAGTQYAGDLQKALESNVDSRSQLKKSNGLVSRSIQAATELATNASEGVKEQRLYQLAEQEAAQLGVPKELRGDYAKARAAAPTRQMLEKATVLHEEINNLNNNPVTSRLNKVSAAIEGKSAVGGLLKNQIMPFTSWLGGNIYNTVTDRNIVASAVKLANSARKGDPEGIVKNLSKLGNNAAQTYALGYVLTDMGILVNEDAQGYNDAGAYIKLGDRYIPVGFFGAFAPNMILGNAAHNGLNSEEAGSPAEKIGVFAGDSLMNMFRSIDGSSALGADNNVSRAIDQATRDGGNFMDGVATLGANMAGQFIPGVTGDINAVLDNHTDLNPTRERADTKVADPNSKSGEARDAVMSALAGLQNRIPVASQALPRKEGVAAKDLVDRVTKGNRDTATSIDTREKEQAKVDQSKDFKARGIPNPDEKNFDEAIKARFENGEYDQAIEGLQKKLDKQNADSNVSKSTKKKTEDEIKRLQVHKDNAFEPELEELYKKTSLSEWRNLGDPESDTYDPEKYQKLWDYDSARANSAISRNDDDKSETFYSAKKAKKGGSGSGRNNALSKIKSNKLGDAPTLQKITLGNLAGQAASATKIPVIARARPNGLIKKRQISVKKA